MHFFSKFIACMCCSDIAWSRMLVVWMESALSIYFLQKFLCPIIFSLYLVQILHFSFITYGTADLQLHITMCGYAFCHTWKSDVHCTMHGFELPTCGSGIGHTWDIAMGSTDVWIIYLLYVWYGKVCPKQILAYPTDKCYGKIYLFT